MQIYSPKLSKNFVSKKTGKITKNLGFIFIESENKKIKFFKLALSKARLFIQTDSCRLF